ncbi:MAG: phosphoribosylglycinamide formyltransferase [Mariprofundaceae bacterium]|nr:phosphoribosylglycinamide formyltransferase [Mariprofundaceae bacterium]
MSADCVRENRIAIMASGKGSNLQAILRAAASGACPVVVRLVLSDTQDAGALAIARDAGVPRVSSLNPKDYPDRAAFDAVCAEHIETAHCDWVVLAGYMRILSDKFIARFRHRVINIHPALLPSFTGAHAVRDALEYGVKVTGVTVHLVDDVLDGGPILAQASVEVRDDDDEATLHRRIQAVEHRLYPATLTQMIANGFRVKGRTVIWNSSG